jgi:predicted metallo-beta-lactamase superfamily hydrolase
VAGTSIDRGIANGSKIASTAPTLILEHHILRSEDWRVEAGPVFDAAHIAEHRVVTAAEYLNQPTSILEARRQQLYAEEEPSSEFMKWTELPRDKRRLQSPPV